MPVIGTTLIIWAGPHAWINRKFLADQKIVFIGLISYPLYLWHWPLIVISRAVVTDYSPANHHVRTTTIVAVVISFVLSWLTFEFVERPIRTRRPSIGLRWAAGASATALAAVALLAIVTLQNDGFPARYPKEIRALLTPLTLGADYPPSDEKKNSVGPLVVVYGDLHAQHLIPGLTLLQNERTFRLKKIGWEECAPVSDVKASDAENCRRLQIATEEDFVRLKPDIVVIGAFWYQYNHIERAHQDTAIFLAHRSSSDCRCGDGSILA